MIKNVKTDNQMFHLQTFLDYKYPYSYVNIPQISQNLVYNG